MTDTPLISCVCPTYKRPECLANVVKCFEAQTWPAEFRELIIVDDANQFGPDDGPNTYGQYAASDSWLLMTHAERFPNLPSKFNHIVGLTSGELIVVWEDDDVYLPNHLAAIAAAYTRDLQLFAPGSVFSTYNEPFGDIHAEPTGGRFHASWAYTRQLFDAVNGYEVNDLLTFDQNFFSRAARAAGGVTVYTTAPTYVYRWGNGIYHGSAVANADFGAHYARLGELPMKKVPSLYPRWDSETLKIFASLGLAAV